MTRKTTHPIHQLVKHSQRGCVVMFLSTLLFLGHVREISSFVLQTPLHQFDKITTTQPTSSTNTKLSVASSNGREQETRQPNSPENSEQNFVPFPVQLNEFFKKPVPRPIKQAVSLYYETEHPEQHLDVVSLLTAAPSVPGCPRPLWLVMLGSLPTGLLWYGYYKFAVEEELLQIELAQGKDPRGFGGYGTLGPFTYGMTLGPLAQLLHIPGGINWSAVGIIFIYYTQFLLYDRVNDLYREQGKEEPLNVWWCLPIFFPFNLIVGLRQVHFLSQYFYAQRGVYPPPHDPVADFFPFIKANKFTWQEFFLTPSLWCSLLANAKSIDRELLPAPLRELLSTTTNKEKL